MKSPINGKPMTLITTKETIIFMRKEVEYEHKAYLCEQSGLTFTTTDQDTYNMERAMDAYQAQIQSTDSDAFNSWWITAVIITGALLIAFLL